MSEATDRTKFARLTDVQVSHRTAFCFLSLTEPVCDKLLEVVGKIEVFHCIALPATIPAFGLPKASPVLSTTPPTVSPRSSNGDASVRSSTRQTNCGVQTNGVVHFYMEDDSDSLAENDDIVNSADRSDTDPAAPITWTEARRSPRDLATAEHTDMDVANDAGEGAVKQDAAYATISVHPIKQVCSEPSDAQSYKGRYCGGLDEQTMLNTPTGEASDLQDSVLPSIADVWKVISDSNIISEWRPVNVKSVGWNAQFCRCEIVISIRSDVREHGNIYTRGGQLATTLKETLGDYNFEVWFERSG